MIIRIMGEGQFYIKSGLFDELNKIDNRIVEYVQKGNEQEFKKGLAELIRTIRKEGNPLDDKELLESDVIVPPADLTIKEAREIFKGTGIFKG
jgi:hypothetical protein